MGRQRVPFHADRLAGVDPAHFTEGQLPSLPVMTKDDLMSEFSWVVTDPRLTLDVVEDHVEHVDDHEYLLDRFRAVTSSGSSGRRGCLRLRLGRMDDPGPHAESDSARDSRHRVTATGDRPPPASSPDAGAHLSRVMRTFLAEPGDEIHHLPMTLPVAEVVSGFNAVQPELLMGYPSAIDLVVREALAGSAADFAALSSRPAASFSWRGPVGPCATCGASRSTIPGLSSKGRTPSPAPTGRAMHLPDDLVIVEPVDSAGRPVAPGEPAAKLYLTNLYNHTQPLIRFEIADGLTLLDDICPCGSAHRRITDLTGRADTVFEYDNGVTVHPMVLRLELHDERHVTEYQVRQTERGLRVKVVTDRPDQLDQVRDRLVGALRTAGLPAPDVTVEAVGRLERLAAGKLRQFIPRLGA